MPAELIAQLVQKPMSASEVQDLFLSFQNAVTERIMNAEMSQHLGYKPREDKPDGQTNERNGASGTTVLTLKGAVRIDVPRDRAGSFEPILIPRLAALVPPPRMHLTRFQAVFAPHSKLRAASVSRLRAVRAAAGSL